MAIFVVWMALCFGVAAIASNKGRSGVGFFFLSLFLSPVVGGIAALIAKPNLSTIEEQALTGGEQKKCPYCAELIKTEARVCKHCGRDVTIGPVRSAGGVVLDEGFEPPLARR